MWWVNLASGLAAAVLVLCSSTNAQTSAATAPKTPACPEIPPVPQGSLGEVDQSFLSSYCALEAGVLSHHPAYVVAAGGSLTLHWSAQSNKAPVTAKIIPDGYHALKDIAHIPLAVYLLLVPLDKGYVTIDGQRAALTDLKDRVVQVAGALDPSYFSKEQVARQRRIIEASEKLLTAALETGSVPTSTLQAFAKSMAPLLMEDSWDAACEQVRTMHAQMMAWKKQLTAEEWAALVAINISGHQPRYRNVATQYFHWLLAGESPAWAYPGESSRVIYAETFFPGQDPSELLAESEIDADAAEAFFGNRWRLSEDLLSDGASDCIANLPAKDQAHR